MEDSQTPEGEKFDVGSDVFFVEILIFIVGVYELFSGRSAHEDESKGGEGARCKDCTGKERSREETPKSFEVDDACGIVHGEGQQVVDREASIDVLDGGDNHLDGE